jgi:hypothetical protein
LTDIVYLLIVNNSLDKRYVFRGQGQPTTLPGVGGLTE